MRGLKKLRLGINVDHVATLRNARGGHHPDPLRAACLAAVAGADQVTAHLREDRRHITDNDISRLRHEGPLPLNLEIAATEEMVAIALQRAPAACCIVPERREEITTEGGLDAAGEAAQLEPIVARLEAAGLQVSLFIDPDLRQVEAAKRLGATAVELHTGAYANADARARNVELERLREASRRGAEIDLHVHAGHGLDYGNVGPVAAIAEIEELNIGHYLVGEAVFTGFESAIRRMIELMEQARRPAHMAKEG